MRLWVISYDISGDTARGLAEKLLLANGDRVNFSVFECYLRAEQFELVRKALASLIDPETDSIRCYPLCVWCEENMLLQGQGRRSHYPSDWIF